MNNKSDYKEQQKLSFAQLLAELPSFVAVLVSAILSRTILVFVDLLDSFENVLRAAMITLLSKKLSKDLRYEYNYGVGKIEALVSLICDGIVFFGLLITLGMAVYSIIFPEHPSDFIIAVVILKAVNVGFDIAFYIKQRKILKTNHSAISETNCAASLGALLFDSITLISLVTMWLLRNNTIGGYISPVMSIIVVFYLIFGCIKRTRSALNELTDKTLPEEKQMRILNVLSRFYNRYTQVDSINSHKIGETIWIDIHLSFESNTSFEEIVQFKKQMQEELDRQIGNCNVNIVVGDE